MLQSSKPDIVQEIAEVCLNAPRGMSKLFCYIKRSLKHIGNIVIYSVNINLWAGIRIDIFVLRQNFNIYERTYFKYRIHMWA